MTSAAINILAPVVQKVDSAIRWINLYPVDSAISFPNTYPLDSAIHLLNNWGLFFNTRTEEQPTASSRMRPM